MSDVLAENSYTLGHLQSHPLAAPLATQFDAFQDMWMEVNTHRLALAIAAHKADGAVAGAEAALHDLIDVVDKSLLIVTKNDRGAALYTNFFGERVPSEIKRLTGNDALEAVGTWADSLAKSSNAALKALGPTFTAAVDTLTQALAAQTKAHGALKDFDAVGEKKLLIDQCNSLRSVAHGNLDALPHQHPEAMLPKHFGDRFFLHASNKGVSALNSIAAVQAKLEQCDKQRAQLAAHLADLQTAEAAKSAARQEAIANAASVAQARKEADEAAKKLRALEKQAKSGKKKGR